MRGFADRHFATIERWASMAGAFGLGALILPAYLPNGNDKLVAGGLVLAMALTKLSLIGWFRYEKLGNRPSRPAGPAATDD